MKQTFPINLVDGHLLISDNGNTILVDTGSPMTVHNAQSLNFLGREFKTHTSILGSKVSDLSKLAGIGFNTLLGMDILSQYRVLFDYENRQLTFLSPDEQGIEGTEIPLITLMGAVGVKVGIAGQEYVMAVDTGAPLSYVSKSVTSGMQPVGEKEDFHPIAGRYTTPVYEIESEVAGRTFTASYGNLPALLALTLQVGNMDGVIGYDFFKSFRVMLDSRSGIAIIG